MFKKLLQQIFKPRPRPRTEPRPSPVDWIDHEVWAAWSQHPDLEAESPIFSPVLCSVSDDDRMRAGRRHIRSDERDSPEGTLEEHARRLSSTPAAAGVVYYPYWPVCCRRLTTMIFCEGAGKSLKSIEAEAGGLDYAFVEALVVAATTRGTEALVYRRQRGYSDELERMRNDRHDGGGFVIYECRHCGRTYVGTCRA